jgi:aspartate beta-hydroxylase
MQTTQNELQARDRELVALSVEAARLADAGKSSEAINKWMNILKVEPNHLPTLVSLGKQLYRLNDFAGSKAAFERIVQLDASDAQHFIGIALACRGLNDPEAEENAISSALTVDPHDLLALIMRATLLEQQGKRHQAARAYGAVAQAAPPPDRIHPSLREAVERAINMRQQYDQELAAYVDAKLRGALQDVRNDNTVSAKRFESSVDILVGRKQRYESQSMIYHYPGLPAIEFFDDRRLFPWIEAIEAQTDAIRAEFESVFRDDNGFEPYIQYPPFSPLNQWRELNHSPQWSAFHLIKSGEVVSNNAVRCPSTMKALKGVPQPDQPGRTPAAMYSLLKAHTHIPPHTGVSNVRSVVHLPLIVPEACQFRVGNEVREWQVGKAWVFDDTIEHEAINRSDKLRVVLIFDVWNPLIPESERKAITELSRALIEFVGVEDGFEL